MRGPGGPNFAPAYGVQLHDPRQLEYVGAPESARLTSRSPEYWVYVINVKKRLILRSQCDLSGV